MTNSNLYNHRPTQEEEEAFVQGMAVEALKNKIDVGYQPAQPLKTWKPAQEQQGPVLDYQMKRFIAVVIVLVAGYCFCAAADNGALDGVMKLLGYVAAIIALVSFVHGALQKD